MKNGNTEQKKNPYATNRVGRIQAPNVEREKPTATVIRPAGDGRA